MHSVCCCSLPVWRRSFLKKGTPVTYFCPALDPPLDGSGRKTTTLVRDLEYFIHTKFHQNPSSGSGEEVENVNSLTDDRRTTDDRRRTTDDGRRTTDDGRRTTDAGQRVIIIGHWSLWLLCPKNWLKKVMELWRDDDCLDPGLEWLQGFSAGHSIRQLIPQSYGWWYERLLVNGGPTVWYSIPVWVSSSGCP